MQQEHEQQVSLNDQMQRRLDERTHLMESGVNPYPCEFTVTAHSRDIIETFQEEARTPVSVAGRIMAIRKMGKASFFHMQDAKGRIQVYLKKTKWEKPHTAHSSCSTSATLWE